MKESKFFAARPGVASPLPVSPPGRVCESGGIIMQALEYLNRGFSIIPMAYRPPANGQKKGDKVPLVKWKDFQETRPTEAQVRDWWTKWPDAMIGVITGSLSGVCTVDVDEDVGYEVLSDIIPDSMTIPTYSTPSGGCQMVFEAPTTPLLSAVRNLPGCDLRAERGIAIFPPSQNAVGKYQWREGLSINDVPPPPLPNAYLDFISSNNTNNKIIYKGDVTPDSLESNKEGNALQRVTFSFDDGCRDESLFHLAITLIRGGMPRHEVEYVVNNAAKICNPPLPSAQIRKILDSAFARKLGRLRNVQGELENWVRETTGNFRVTEAYLELQIVTKEEKAAARMAFRRLVLADIIEKVGDKNGNYRLKQAVCDKIDWENADVTPYDVVWPFGIEKFVKIYRKSIIIVAGEGNAGKTAMCLNIAKMNQCKNPTYFMSEGDATELHDRILQFGEPAKNWNNVDFRTIKSANLAKIIDPDGFNIVDYLEIHKDFYEVSGIINEIYEKLSTGIAVIAMQKPAGRDLGIGGRGTMDKARLYLSVEPGRLKIVKGKIWAREGVNPNGMSIKWKLVKGCKFIPEGYWVA